MKKKIFVFLFRLNGGGAERTVVNIINKLDPSEFDVVLVLGSSENNHYLDLISKDVRIEYLYRSQLRKCLFKLREKIIEEKPDLLFTTMNPNNIMLICAKVISFKKIPIIVREANNRTQSGKVSTFNKLITKVFYNFADKVIALSYGVKKDLIENFEIEKSNVEVIYNPIDVTHINQVKNESINDLIFDKHQKTIIAVGRLEEQKDFETLIHAFKIVQKNVNSRLVIIGKGTQETALKKLVTNLELSDKVVFLGFRENPQKYVKQSDVFVLSSRWEGFGHVIVEAMAVGTPVVVTNCNSGPYEIIKDNEYGLIARVGDPKEIAEKIIVLLQDMVKYSHYSDKGLARAEKFDSKVIVKEYEKVFKLVIDSKVK